MAHSQAIEIAMVICSISAVIGIWGICGAAWRVCEELRRIRIALACSIVEASTPSVIVPEQCA